jgi:hypothetical protein
MSTKATVSPIRPAPNVRTAISVADRDRLNDRLNRAIAVNDIIHALSSTDDGLALLQSNTLQELTTWADEQLDPSYIEVES